MENQVLALRSPRSAVAIAQKISEFAYNNLLELFLTYLKRLISSVAAVVARAAFRTLGYAHRYSRRILLTGHLCTCIWLDQFCL